MALRRPLEAHFEHFWGLLAKWLSGGLGRFILSMCFCVQFCIGFACIGFAHVFVAGCHGSYSLPINFCIVFAHVFVAVRHRIHAFLRAILHRVCTCVRFVQFCIGFANGSLYYSLAFRCGSLRVFVVRSFPSACPYVHGAAKG